MPPLTVEQIEEDGDGGYFIEWHDPSNMEDQEVTGFFHLTEASIVDLIRGQRRPNRAPQDKLEAVIEKLAEGAPQALIGQLWRAAYDEVLTDRIDRYKFGMRAVTSNGHADLVAVRGGAAVLPENAVSRRPSGFEDFIDASQ